MKKLQTLILVIFFIILFNIISFANTYSDYNGYWKAKTLYAKSVYGYEHDYSVEISEYDNTYVEISIYFDDNLDMHVLSTNTPYGFKMVNVVFPLYSEDIWDMGDGNFLSIDRENNILFQFNYKDLSEDGYITYLYFDKII